ncbi:hypothetical protein [Kitasatospora sp. NPDC058218]|uniref:hypothetical protein n=1 Tax=Kitasatospora sp. NPDC058218 TaxID=3346385 RepID=UPI0036D816DE
MADSSLIISIVGVGGTLAGGALTGWINSRSQKRTEAAREREQIRQVEAEGRSRMHSIQVEHQTWLRERRESAYLAFLHAAHTARDDLRNLAQIIATDSSAPNAVAGASQAARNAMMHLISTHAPVQISGPFGVAEAADAYVSAITAYWGYVDQMVPRRESRALTEGEEDQMRLRVGSANRSATEAEKQFASEAQKSLGSITIA